MTINKYCHLVGKSLNIRGAHFYAEHLEIIIRRKLNYKLYIEEELQNINFFLEVLRSFEY